MRKIRRAQASDYSIILGMDQCVIVHVGLLQLQRLLAVANLEIYVRVVQ